MTRDQLAQELHRLKRRNETPLALISFTGLGIDLASWQVTLAKVMPETVLMQLVTPTRFYYESPNRPRLTTKRSKIT